MIIKIPHPRLANNNNQDDEEIAEGRPVLVSGDEITICRKCTGWDKILVSSI